MDPWWVPGNMLYECAHTSKELEFTYTIGKTHAHTANILFTPAFYGNALSTLTRTHTLYFVPCWCGFIVVDSPNHCTLYFVVVECGCGLFSGALFIG